MRIAIAALPMFFVACGEPSHPVVVETILECDVNQSLLDSQDGWQVRKRADRMRLAKLAGEGKVIMEPRPGTLSCALWRGDEFVQRFDYAALWYWKENKPIRKRSTRKSFHE